MSGEKQNMMSSSGDPPAYQPNVQGYPQQQGQVYYPPQGQYYPPQPQQGQQPHVMYVQPGTTVVAPSGVAPPDHLVYAILVTIFCCWPIGIFAILKSSECRSATNRGDYQRANEFSSKTKSLANWALGIGIVFSVISITAVVLLYVLYLIPLWASYGNYKWDD